MSTIYKRGKNWHIQYRDNGKLVQRSLKTHAKRLAEIKQAEIDVNLDRGRLGMGRRIKSSADAFENFEAEVLAKKSPPWQKRTEQLFRNFKLWAIGQTGVAVTDFSPSDIERFLIQRGKDIAPKTLNEELAIIKRFYRWAIAREFLVKDPTAGIERSKPNPKAIRTFTDNELHMIMKYATPYQRPFYQMLLYTGMRDGELRNLEWTDLDFDKRVIYIRIKSDWKPKTGKGRVIPMAKEAFDLLYGMPRSGKYVFCTRNLKKWVPPRQPWVDLVERIKNAEGVDLKHQVSLHTFRHTFATVCLMNGVDIKTVSEFLGHTSVRMTEKYLHVLPDHKIAAIGKVDFARLLTN